MGKGRTMRNVVRCVLDASTSRPSAAPTPAPGPRARRPPAYGGSKAQRNQCVEVLRSVISIHEKANAKTYNLVAAVGLELVTSRRTAVLGNISKRTATQHTFLAFLRSLRVDRLFLRISAEPILAPLPDVAVHVMKHPRIGGVTSYRRGCKFRLAFHPFAEVGLLGGKGITAVIRRRCSGTAGIFPFCFGWQAVRLAVLGSQFLDEFLAIVPRHLFHGQIPITLGQAGGLIHYRVPLPLGHGGDPHVKAFGQLDFVLDFVLVPALFIVGTPHDECAGRNPYELDSDVIGEMLRWVHRLGVERDSDGKGCSKWEAQNLFHGGPLSPRG